MYGTTLFLVTFHLHCTNTNNLKSFSVADVRLTYDNTYLSRTPMSPYRWTFEAANNVYNNPSNLLVQ